MPVPKATPAKAAVTEEAEEAPVVVEEPLNPNETIPGGKYIHTSGVLVNAFGQPIDEDGNILDEIPLLRG